MTTVSTATKHRPRGLPSVSDLEGRESCCWLWTIANTQCLLVVALIRPLKTVGPDANNSKFISSYRQPWLIDLCAGAPCVIVEQLEAGGTRTGTICSCAISNFRDIRASFWRLEERRRALLTGLGHDLGSVDFWYF